MEYLDKTVAGETRISTFHAHRVWTTTWPLSLQDEVF
jgi:hypothetical protein